MSQDHDGEGSGKTIHEAAEKAWKDAKDNQHKTQGWYEIKTIEAKAQNPITEYKVKIKRVRDL
jgi:hypothetical protein